MVILHAPSCAEPASVNLAANWTPLARAILISLIVVYVAQILSGGLMIQYLAWHPFGAGFFPWQVASSFLLSGPDPTSALFQWLGLFFFIAPVESALGRRGFAPAMGVVWVVAVVPTLILAALSLPQMTLLGAVPMISALVALFGFLNPHAQILLFFILPIRASWLAWGTGLVTFLYLLYAPSTSTAVAFFAWVGAWGFVTLSGGGVRRIQLRWKRRKIERRMSRLTVIEGGRAGPKGNEWVN